jgi:hypothetical protein
MQISLEFRCAGLTGQLQEFLHQQAALFRVFCSLGG